MTASRNGRWRGVAGGALGLLSLLLSLAGGAPAEAAFEAAPGGVGGVPILAPRSGIDFAGRRFQFGVQLGVFRWASLPELSWQRGAAWTHQGRWSLGFSLERLALVGYDEQALRLRVTQEPVTGEGWSGGLSVGVARWGSLTDRRQAALAGFRAAWGATSGVQARVVAEGALGSLSDAIPDRFLLAFDAPVAAGWTAGVVLETNGHAPRLHLTTVCRLAELQLGCRLLPAQGLFGLAIGYRPGRIALDLSREEHPGLGALSGAEVAFGLGRREGRP